MLASLKTEVVRASKKSDVQKSVKEEKEKASAY